MGSQRSPIALLGALSLHCEVIAGLDPDPARIESIGAVDPLGTDAFCAKPANLREDDSAFSVVRSLNRMPASVLRSGRERALQPARAAVLYLRDLALAEDQMQKDRARIERPDITTHG
jgi:hypothetical protein